MKELTLAEFGSLLGGFVVEIEHMKRESLKEVAELVEKGAKEVIGTYDYGWPELAESTQAQREHLGFAPNEPLLRTGDMRDSIEHCSDDHEARIGSDSDIALWQEMGTSKIPPRSFLKDTMVRKMPKIKQIIGERLVAAFTGQKLIP